MSHILTGTAHVYPIDNIDTDRIIPGKYTKTLDLTHLAGHVLEDLDPTFSQRVQPGDILVAGRNFGCGSSREQAPLALKAAGVSAVIAHSFARIFFRNAINIGLLVIELPDHALKNGAQVTIDSVNGLVESEGVTYQATKMPQVMLTNPQRRRADQLSQSRRGLPMNRPLTGLRVLEFTHAVLGPTTGLILSDLGAEVIRVEPVPGGDPTRTLKGFGLGYFPFFNRNKKSIGVNLKDVRGRDLITHLLHTTDILIENYAPGTMERLHLGYDDLSHPLSPPHLLPAQRVPAWPLPDPHRPGRSGANDERPGLHDRAGRSAIAGGGFRH
ncbi:MAG: CoA transferase [Candidatus Promineifilaceae bacterium]